jgi:hypothetical protein
VSSVTAASLLRIHEIVDASVWNVGMTMPAIVFAQRCETPH